MKYLFLNLETATNAERLISQNMGLELPNRHDVPRLINNPNHVDFGKSFIHEVEGDEYHHALWMTGVTGFEIVEYDINWFLPEEI